MNTRTSDSIELSVMRLLCKRFKTAFSHEAGQALATPEAYLGLDLDPARYTNASTFSKDLLLYSFLRKWKGWKMAVDPAKVAFSSWTAAESKCYLTNRFLNESAHPFGALIFISKIQRKIEQIIGKYPPEDIFESCRWSSGSTSTIRRAESDVSIKMSRVVSVTRSALPHLMAVMDDKWKSINPIPYRVVSGNRMVMVPKNAKTHRPIASEPTGNAFLQQGVGRFLKRRLLAFGVDLYDQSVNRSLAFSALVDELSTIDLSSASDTLSISTVRLLVPKAWYDLMSDLRSPKTTYLGKTYNLEKFSSMGNAFTFELESLIFFAISKVVVEECQVKGPVSVFGDDIIIPKQCYDALAAALNFFGFIVNNDKSYKDGSFYESCGGQYFDLEDVTPPYQKEVCNKTLFELIALHNRLYRWGLRNGMHLVKDACLFVKEFTRKKHPKLRSLPEIPWNHPGDLGFLGSLKPRRDGDYDCYVLAYTVPLWYCISEKEQRGSYAYRLRNSSASNLCPDGHLGLKADGYYTLRKQRIWASSLLE